MATTHRLESGRWQVRYRDAAGAQRKASLPTKRAAADYGAARESDARHGLVEPDGRITFGEYYEEWWARRLKQKATLRKNASHARRHVLPQWAHRRLREITRADCERWVAGMVRAGVKPPTVHAVMDLTSAVLRTAVRDGRLAVNPISGVERPTIPPARYRVLTVPEVGTLLAAIPARFQAMVFLTARTGMRWGEAAGLQAEEVNLNRSQLTVLNVLQSDGTLKPFPKNEQPRVVPFGPDVHGVLTEHLGAPRRTGGFLFTGTHGRPVNDSWFRRSVWYKARAAADLPGRQPTFHHLRHSYAQLLADENVPPHVIADVLGHKSTRHIGKYIHAAVNGHDMVLDAIARATAAP